MQFNYQGKKVHLKGLSESDWIYSVIKETNLFYEIDLLKYIKYSMGNTQKGCLLDIGANIGNHSVFFGLYLAESVISFEPNPKLFPILLDNLSNNAIKHKAYNLGLGDKETKATLELADRHANNIGASRLTETKDITNVSSETITVVPLDKLMTEIDTFSGSANITGMKVDVEGMEADVLRGGTGLLEKYKPDLFVEILDSEQMENVLSVLSPIGYRPIVSWAATPVWHFAHKDKLNLFRVSRLFLYAFIHKKIRPYLGAIKSRIKQ